MKKLENLPKNATEGRIALANRLALCSSTSDVTIKGLQKRGSSKVNTSEGGEFACTSYDIWRLKGIPVNKHTEADRKLALNGLPFKVDDVVPGGKLYTYFHSHLEKTKELRGKETIAHQKDSKVSESDFNKAKSLMDLDFAKSRGKRQQLALGDAPAPKQAKRGGKHQKHGEDQY